MFGVLFVLLPACSLNSGPIYFESGTYVLSVTDPESYEMTEEDVDYSAELETFALVVDLENLTAEITGTSFDTTLTLKERPKGQWFSTCPMQMSATDVQTVDIVDDVALWGNVHQGTFLYAYDCHGEARTTDKIVLADGETEYEILFLTKQ